MLDARCWMFDVPDREPSRFATGRNGLGCWTIWRLLALVAAANRDGSRSAASRWGPTTCRSAWGSDSPNSSIGPASSPLRGRMISRKPPCSRTSSPTSSAACSATPAPPHRRTPSPSLANGTSRWTAGSLMPSRAASRRIRSNSSPSSKARARAIPWTARLRSD